mmetsp:Transcript_6245/g.13744  ORF Transcript_6245/g.13744 Transcript_6245/m.13744 type:complete len:129 (-) Transcript_6245:121-507(-)
MVFFSVVHMFTFAYKEYHRCNRHFWRTKRKLSRHALMKMETLPSHPIDHLPYPNSGLFSRLDDPLSLWEALWGSTVPRETLDDIKRLGVVTGGVMPGSFGLGGLQGGRNGDGNGIDISLTSLNNAESI